VNNIFFTCRVAGKQYPCPTQHVVISNYVVVISNYVEHR